jgi:ketopantoate reductase
MKTLIVGAGALGGIIGARLLAVGAKVTGLWAGGAPSV